MDERRIIEVLTEVLGQPREPFSQIGDDVAFMPVRGEKLVVKCDMLVRRTDVPKGMNLRLAARKAIAMCTSDFASKGVRPLAALISLGIPRNLATKRGITSLAKGFRDAKEEFSIEILGGDTNEADDLIIDCCMFGFGQILASRRGAREGDLVVTSGPFGFSASGLRILTGGAKARPAFRERAVGAILRPRPRLDLGLALAKAGLVTASMDSSDGLALTLHEIALQSGVSMILDELPAPEEVFEFAQDNGIDPWEVVLFGGEEYELVFTVPKESLSDILQIGKGIGCELLPIGRVGKGPPRVELLTMQGKAEIPRRGWIHLRGPTSR